MKTKSILKIAVVFMAAFGAYAFSGNTQPNLYSYKESGICTNVVVPCTDTGNNICKIEFDSNFIFDVWDLGCSRVLMHESNVPIQIGK